MNGRAELEQGLEAIGVRDQETAEMLRGLLLDVDENDDGKINYHEFIELSGLAEVRLSIMKVSMHFGASEISLRSENQTNFKYLEQV